MPRLSDEASLGTNFDAFDFRSGVVIGGIMQGLFEVRPGGRPGYSYSCYRDTAGVQHADLLPEGHEAHQIDTLTLAVGEDYSLTTKQFHAVATNGLAITCMVKTRQIPYTPALVLKPMPDAEPILRI
jgi:hypothetical protein